MLNFLSRRTRKASTESETPAQLEAFRIYLDEFKTELLNLIRSHPITKPAGEPLAPWVCYHYPLEFDAEQMASRGIDPSVYFEKSSFYWHTLDAAHCTRSFFEHFFALSLQGKVEYFRRYDLGPHWPDRENWFHLAFDEDPNVSDDDYEFAHSQVFNEQKSADDGPRR